jgi:hypothetical protein
LGLINDKWASRILKGTDVIDSYVYKDTEISEGFPNQNYIVGWVLRTVTIPNINPHQIMKTTQALVKQALDRISQKKAVAPIEETKKVELEKVPESQLKRTQAKGWVKEEGMATQQEEEEQLRKAFQERMVAKREEEKAKAEGKSASTSVLKTGRQLPKIPDGSTKDVSIVEPKAVELKTEVTKSAELKSVETKTGEVKSTIFCPFCGKDLTWQYCPYCGKKLPH